MLYPTVVWGADGSLVLIPESGTYSIQENFQVQLFADPDGVAGKAAEADIRFNQNLLEVAAISTAGSVMTLWSVEPTYSNEEGLISFSGWSNQPFVGNRSLLLTITFRPKASGTHTVRIESGALLASDSRATNILTKLGTGVYTTKPETITALPDGAAVLGAQTQSEDAPPEAPTITEYSDDLQSGDRLMVSGAGSKGGRVNVWLEKDGGKAVHESIDVDEKGSFVYMSKERLEAGSYRMWFESYSSYGVLSQASKPVSFVVMPDGGNLVAATVYSVFSAPLFMGLALLLFGFLFGYLTYRVFIVRAK